MNPSQKLGATAALEELLGFLFNECCSRSNAVDAKAVTRLYEIAQQRRKR